MRSIIEPLPYTPLAAFSPTDCHLLSSSGSPLTAVHGACHCTEDTHLVGKWARKGGQGFRFCATSYPVRPAILELHV